MKPTFLRIFSEDNPRAIQLLNYWIDLYEAVPANISLDWEDVKVSCHHLCAIMKQRFEDVVHHHGHIFNSWKAPISHSWLWVERDRMVLDMYPPGSTSWPILFHDFMFDPKRYGKHKHLLLLKEDSFKKQIDYLLSITEHLKILR